MKSVAVHPGLVNAWVIFAVACLFLSVKVASQLAESERTQGKEKAMKQVALKIATFAILFTMCAVLLTAQTEQQERMMGSPNYDTASETTVKGSVEAVSRVNGSHGRVRSYLSVKTDEETIIVHLGPSWFLSQHNMSFAKGDQVEVTGSRVKVGTEDAVIAREVKKNGQTFTFRNSQGIPAWAGMGRGREPAS